MKANAEALTLVTGKTKKCEQAKSSSARYVPVLQKNAEFLHRFGVRFTVLTNQGCIRAYMNQLGLNSVNYPTTNMTPKCWEKYHHPWCLKRDALRYMTTLQKPIVFIDADFLITSCQFMSLFRLQLWDFDFAAAPQHCTAKKMNIHDIRFNSGLFIMNAGHFSEQHFRRHFECWSKGDQTCLSKYVTRYHDYLILPMYTHCRNDVSDFRCMGNHHKRVLRPQTAEALYYNGTWACQDKLNRSPQ